MSQLDEAVVKYNKLLEAGPYSDLAWAEALQERMESGHLSAGGRLICPFLRPNFISPPAVRKPGEDRRIADRGD